MKSIETIKNAIRVLDENITLAYDEYKPYIICERDEYKQVLKDLEVLEILKKLAKGVIGLKEKNIDITKYVVLISESTNEKIKKWLDA